MSSSDTEACSDLSATVASAEQKRLMDLHGCGATEETLRYPKPLVIGCGLVFFQQVTGQPSVLYFAVEIFKAILAFRQRNVSLRASFEACLAAGLKENASGSDGLGVPDALGAAHSSIEAWRLLLKSFSARKSELLQHYDRDLQNWKTGDFSHDVSSRLCSMAVRQISWNEMACEGAAPRQKPRILGMPRKPQELFMRGPKQLMRLGLATRAFGR